VDRLLIQKKRAHENKKRDGLFHGSKQNKNITESHNFLVVLIRVIGLWLWLISSAVH